MITPNPEVAELTRRARESWQSLRRGESWEHWLTIGRAIDAFRRQLFHDLKINEPKGQAYKEAMGTYLAENGWQQPTKEDPNGIDNTARVNLQKLVDRLPEFEAWRATLPLGNQLKQNHPNTVWRAFAKAFPDEFPNDNGTKRKVETQHLREQRNAARQERDDAKGEIDRLTAEVETLTARAETAEAQAGFVWDETPDKVAERMAKANPGKVAGLATELMCVISDEKRAEIIEAFTGGEPEALPDGVFYYEEPLTFFANFFADYTPEKVRELARQIAETEEPLKVVEALRELANHIDGETVQTTTPKPKRERLGRKTVRVRPGETIPESVARAERERAEKLAAKATGAAGAASSPATAGEGEATGETSKIPTGATLPP